MFLAGRPGGIAISPLRSPCTLITPLKRSLAGTSGPLPGGLPRAGRGMWEEERGRAGRETQQEPARTAIENRSLHSAPSNHRNRKPSVRPAPTKRVTCHSGRARFECAREESFQGGTGESREGFIAHHAFGALGTLAHCKQWSALIAFRRSLQGGNRNPPAPLWE